MHPCFFTFRASWKLVFAFLRLLASRVVEMVVLEGRSVLKALKWSKGCT